MSNWGSETSCTLYFLCFIPKLGCANWPAVSDGSLRFLHNGEETQSLVWCELRAFVFALIPQGHVNISNIYAWHILGSPGRRASENDWYVILIPVLGVEGPRYSW